MVTMLKDLKAERGFYRALVSVSGPIMLQNFLISSLSFIDTLMIGQLGSVQIAGVGLANQVFFLTILFFFGIGSGASIFIAQYWGKGDTASIHAAMGVALTTSFIGAAAVSTVSMLLPHHVMSIFSTDPQVIELGASYLRIVALSYLFTSISFIFSTSLRSMRMAKYPLVSTACSLTVNVLLNYLLIFGKFGFPAMGVRGAALATVISRGLELVIILSLTYGKRTPAAGVLRVFFSYDRKFVKKFFRTAFPVICNELVWSLGMVVYKIVYARMGTEVIASANVSEAIQSLFFVIYIGTGNGSAVLIGNKIGSREYDTARRYARRFLLLPVLAGLFIGILMAICAPLVTRAFNIEQEIIQITIRSLRVLALLIPIRGLTIHLIIGVLRSGGDTTFSFILELTSVWGIGVPIVLFAGLVLNLPIYYVYLLLGFEEVFKAAAGILRFRSGKWLNDLTEDIPPPESQVISASGTEIP